MEEEYAAWYVKYEIWIVERGICVRNVEYLVQNISLQLLIGFFIGYNPV